MKGFSKFIKGGFNCTCPSGYSGKDCTIDPCSSQPCKNGGTCSVSNGNFFCQ